MGASLKLEIPTSSGYKGNHPEGWNVVLNKAQYANWLRNKGVNDEIIKNDNFWINGEDIMQKN